MKYYIKKFSCFSEEKQKEYLEFLDKEKLSQFNSATNQNRKKSILISHGFLKEAVSQEYNINKKDLVFSVTEKGKPFCRSHEDIHFSISHSGDYFAVAISDFAKLPFCKKYATYPQGLLNVTLNKLRVSPSSIYSHTVIISGKIITLNCLSICS